MARTTERLTALKVQRARRGHLDKLLPARGKVRKVEHHAALHYGELPGFMAALREQEGIAARALEFTILTATRVGETRFARWSELDLLDETWTVPSRRMKSGREHRVPLSARVLDLAVVPAHLDATTAPAHRFFERRFSVITRAFGSPKIPRTVGSGRKPGNEYVSHSRRRRLDARAIHH
jgi:integrase